MHILTGHVFSDISNGNFFVFPYREDDRFWAVILPHGPNL